MNYHIAVALTSCVLAGVFGQFSADWGMLGWIGFASWAAFFAAGGGIKGAQKTVVTNLFGVAIGCAVVYIASVTGMSNPMLLPLMGGVFIMCAAGYFSFLSFVPGSFIGCAAYLGSGALALESIASLLVGIILGFIAERGALMLAKGKK
ncbi:DUF1097 domain-containing protein [Desulfoplanes formicivorans]|uniref:Membrane protein n=1 Tax=Desulfoplanes formicivorans TaxID=1592317 RepID=A0A194AHC4_9BACT|nr:DUF1097 domain-containing protein [Desulfoplanes formicivorans]GAU08159.1 membrane protein [Desulfoplanes formicivorans]